MSPSALRVELELVLLLQEARRHEEAENLLRTVYPALVQIWGKDHENTLAAQQHLANVYLSSYRLGEAAEILADLVERLNCRLAM